MAVMQVAVTKSKGFVEIDTEQLPDDVYAEALLQGLKVLLNRGMSKITKAELGSEDTVKAEAQVKAEKNKEAILKGDIKFTGGKAKKASGVVMTEARRLAKNLVKDEMKRAGIKVSHVEAKEITKAANAYLDSTEGAGLIAKAEANIAEREKVNVAGVIDIKALIKESPALVAKAEARKAKPKDNNQLSAKQAGMTLKAKPVQASVN